MLPDNTLSAVEEKEFLPPRNEIVRRTESRELGGIALADNSEPFTHKWYGYLQGRAISANRRDEAPTTLLYTTGNVTEVSLTFDQNMRPTICYVEDGMVKLYWYDASLASMTITEYPAASSPRVSLDDKRKFNIGNSDIIFAYVMDNNRLCYRLQRERYGIEHTLLVDEEKTIIDPLVLNTIGMSTDNRFLFSTN